MVGTLLGASPYTKLSRHHRQYLKDPMVCQVTLTKQNMSLMMMRYLCIIFLHNLLFQLVSSQAPMDPSPTNCLAAPCMYKGECRGASDTCGASNDYCNSESIWIPACGGGAGLDRPVVTSSPSPPPQSPPTGTCPSCINSDYCSVCSPDQSGDWSTSKLECGDYRAEAISVLSGYKSSTTINGKTVTITNSDFEKACNDGTGKYYTGGICGLGGSLNQFGGKCCPSGQVYAGNVLNCIPVVCDENVTPGECDDGESTIITTPPPTKMPTTISPPSRQPIVSEDTSLSPTTAWELWISQQNGGGGDDKQENEGTNINPKSNETDWFNDVADSWGTRFNDTEKEDDGGLIDGFGDFWGSKNLARESPSRHIVIMFLMTAVGAWAILC